MRIFWRSKVKALILCVFVLLILVYININRNTIVAKPQTNKAIEFIALPETKKRHHKIFKNVYVSAYDQEQKHIQNDEPVDVGIATQSSIYHLDNLIQLARIWKGPISIGVLVIGSQWEQFGEKIKTLILCHPDIARYVTFHALLPLSHPPDQDVLTFSINKTDKCDPARGDIKDDQNEAINYDNTQVSYPVNALRNIAVDNMMTSHVLMLDVDMLPNVGLRDFLIQKVLSEKSHMNKAYVLPAFEIFSRSALPNNKAELLKEWDDGRIRPFYSTVCWKCQKQTDYEEWRRGSKDGEDSYIVEWKDPWEPFYVAHRRLIRYDERFEQYGFNRISQLCDLHLRGVNFYVLYNVFLLHIGFKDPNAFHSRKDEENRRNRILYQRFKMQKTKETKSGRHC